MSRFIYLQYVAASAAALGLDMCVFLAGLAIGMGAVPAVALGYCTGIAIHWLLSSRVVFASRRAPVGAPRRHQQMSFVGSALAGLLATIAIVQAGNAFIIDPRLSKLVAIAVSFQLTYWLRRHLVFS